jgi:organic radical activating enzyme
MELIDLVRVFTGSEQASKKNQPALRGEILVDSLTIVLTEVCNLDCWMCDFAKSKKLTKVNPLGVDGIIDLLKQPEFSQLKVLTLTGGEPFVYPEIKKLVQTLHVAFPSLHIYFSSNCTQTKKMHDVFDNIRSWPKTKLFISIDGIKKHDVQRGQEGLFIETMDKIQTVRTKYPELKIVIKYTVTPINFDELQNTYRYFCEREFDFRGKLIEVNHNYTSKVNYAEHNSTFRLREEQVFALTKQLDQIIEHQRSLPKNHESIWLGWTELRESLAIDWQRNSACKAPTKSGFLDCDLNFYTCKEYFPVANLSQGQIGQALDLSKIQQIVACEKDNSGHCTQCTSPMRR